MYIYEDNKIFFVDRDGSRLEVNELAIMLDRKGVLLSHGESKIVFSKFRVLSEAFRRSMGEETASDICYIVFNSDTIEQGVRDLNKMCECTGYVTKWLQKRGIQ